MTSTTWKDELKNNIKTANDLKNLLNLSESEVNEYEKLLERFPMSVTRYYLSLIDWTDKADPIRRLCIPSISETIPGGSFDTSGEASNTVLPGLQHKYGPTALLLSTTQCAMYCRHCFRKRLVGLDSSEILKEYDKIVKYIREHKDISNVLITGGDSFLCDNKTIEKFLAPLTEIEHLDFIRFGTRTPVTFPERINSDPELLNIIKKYGEKKQLMLVSHFNHPREFTKESKESISLLRGAGMIVKNQTVLLKGVNDNPETLASLLREATKVGVVPYYVFQCRPVTGVKSRFQIPIKEGIRITEAAKKLQNGQGKCFRYIMSHPTGKIEIIDNLPNGETVFRYHQAKYPEDSGRMFTLKLHDDQSWIGDDEIPKLCP